MSNRLQIAPRLIALVCLVLIPYQQIEAQTFSDITTSPLDNGENGQAVSWVDFDNDGDLDLYVGNNGGTNRLYGNNGNGTFTEVLNSGLNDGGTAGGVAWGDYDNDGDLDLYRARAQGGVNQLFENNGNGTFTDMAGIAEVDDAGDGRSAAWADFNGDGHLDLYVGNAINTVSQPNRLYQNDGDGTFTEVAGGLGVGGGLVSSLSVGWADYDNDGDPDLFVANVGDNVVNRLYRNNGGTFTDEAGNLGLDLLNRCSQSVAWGDYDNDGDLDLYLGNNTCGNPNHSLNSLFENNGNGTFTDVSNAKGVDHDGNSNNTAWIDFDLDGDLDLYVVNAVGPAAQLDPNALYENDGNGNFTEVAVAQGVSEDGESSGLATGDYDNDGDVDIYLGMQGEANILLQNTTVNQSWLGIRLVGTESHKGAMGSRVTAITGALHQMRELNSSASASQPQPLRLAYGFGNAASVDSIIVDWPSGRRQVLTNTTPDRILTLTELQGAALKAGKVFGAPGDTVKVPMLLSSVFPVGGMQFESMLGDTQASQFEGLADTSSQPGFASTSNVVNDTARVVMHTTNASVIPQDTDRQVMSLIYVIDNGAALGSTNTVTLLSVEIGDSLGLALADTIINGAIQVGVRGDINLDNRVSILDVIKLVRIIIGSDPTPAAGSTAFTIADMNEDGDLNITDVVAQVNNILDIAPKAVASAPKQPVTISLDAMHTLPDGSNVLPVTLGTDGLIAGTQLAFSFDPALIEIGVPQLAETAENLGFDHHIEDGTLRLVVFGMQPGTGISAGNNAVLFLPVTLLGNTATAPSVTLTEALLVDAQAQTVPVQFGVIAQTVNGKNAAVPGSFSLGEATPNPFNPATTISYDVPQQTHVTLTVYNLLGQEVVRLVDQVQQAGRYQVTWNAINGQGTSVASGVYLYRLTSDTGHSESRRMTLLK